MEKQTYTFREYDLNRARETGKTREIAAYSPAQAVHFLEYEEQQKNRAAVRVSEGLGVLPRGPQGRKVFLLAQ